MPQQKSTFADVVAVSDFTRLSLDFAIGGSGVPYLRSGWGRPERDGVWSIGNVAVIELPKFAKVGATKLSVTMRVLAFLSPPLHTSQTVAMNLDGARVGQWELLNTQLQELEVVLDTDRIANETSTIDLYIASARSPAALGLSMDGRHLGVSLRSLSVTRAS